MMHRPRTPLLAAAFALALAACGSDLTPDEARGRELFVAHGCDACHVVPGIRTARGVSGPPLDAFGRRVLIAGNLPNTRPALARWIVSPQDVEPGTAMPDLDVSPGEADAIARYLLSLR